MSSTLLNVGLACIIAAIIGGGLKAFGLEIPILDSWKRQILLAIFGGALLLYSSGGEKKEVPDDLRRKAAEAVIRARELYEKTLYDQAISQCDNALQFDPANSEARELKSSIEQTKKILGK